MSGDSLRRISFCTTAMGRLDHVRETLLRNTAANADYPAAEFVLLDYASRDGLADWARAEAMDLIQARRLTYLRLDGAQYFNHCHSRNACCLASTGDVLCMVDADNLLPAGFAFHLNDIMHRSPRAMAGFGRSQHSTKGRLAFFREDFLAVGGYDESFEGWGWEDKDLRARLCAAGCQFHAFDVAYAECIEHGNHRRVENFPPELQGKSATSFRNQQRSARNIAAACFAANAGREWGSATLRRNFSEPIMVGARSPAIAPAAVSLDDLAATG